MSTYRCPHCQAVVQRAHLCTRCGAPQSTRVLRGFTLAIASALAIALFAIATVALQNAGVHRWIDNEHTVGNWDGYEPEDHSPPGNRAGAPAILLMPSRSDAGIW